MCENPAVLSVMSPEPIFHLEWLKPIECLRAGSQATSQIFRMDSFRPAFPQFLLERATPKFKPSLIEVRVRFVDARHPDHRRSPICDEARSFFVLDSPIRVSGEDRIKIGAFAILQATADESLALK